MMRNMQDGKDRQFAEETQETKDKTFAQEMQGAQIRKDYLWNMIGSAVYALSAVVLAFLTMHAAGPLDGGIFGFGFSTFGQQMFIVAYFGIRPFHITDSRREYLYEDYRRLRQKTVLAAVLAALCYLLVMLLAGRYTLYKCTVIFLLALYKIADGIGDLYESECQRDGKLSLGAQELTLRTVLATCFFAAGLLGFHSLIAAALLALSAHLIVLLLFRQGPLKVVLKAESSRRAGAGTSDRQLLQNTVLLFLSVFVDFYIFSASKYAIDFYLTDADSGIFNILFMPTSVIYLAANFIIRPYMTRLSDIYAAKDYPRFQKAVRLLALSVGVLSLLAVAGTLLVGRFVLILFERLLGSGYAGMLFVHHWEFVLIIAGGCFYALNNLFYYVLVIMRQQKMIFYNYLCMAIAAFVLTRKAVLGYGMEGAATAYPLYMLLIVFVFVSTMRKQLKKEQEEERDLGSGTF